MTIKQKTLSESLALIFKGIKGLRDTFNNTRQFTIDGRLVGDIGEVIAANEYDIVLDNTSQPNYDGTSHNGRRVQIKATFQDQLTFKTVPDYYIGLKLNENGTHEEVYNGPGKYIFEHYAKRKGIGVTLLRFPISELKKLQTKIQNDEKIPHRKNDNNGQNS
jgi:hypothetical protein